MWNGVDHLGMGSKLLTQQEQDTLVDGGMWRLHKGPVIGVRQAAASPVYFLSATWTFARVSSANRCLVVRVRQQAQQDTFSLHVSGTVAEQDSSTEAFKKVQAT